MTTYKLIGTKPNETPDEAIVRCANNLVKAVLAAGYLLHSTPEVSSIDIDFHRSSQGKISIRNILSDWRVLGNTPLKITFKSEEPENDLTQDDADCGVC